MCIPNEYCMELSKQKNPEVFYLNLTITCMLFELFNAKKNNTLHLSPQTLVKRVPALDLKAQENVLAGVVILSSNLDDFLCVNFFTGGCYFENVGACV
jgi:hypothetical protein